MTKTLLNRSGNSTSVTEAVLNRVLEGKSFDEALQMTEGAIARFLGFEKPKQKGRMMRPADTPILAHPAHDPNKILKNQPGREYDYWDSHDPSDLPVYKPTWMKYRTESQTRVGDAMDALKSRPPIGTRVELNVKDTPNHILNGKRGTVVSYCAWEGSNNVGVELDGRSDPDGPSYWNPDDLILVNESLGESAAVLYHHYYYGPNAVHNRRALDKDTESDIEKVLRTSPYA